MEAQSVNIVSIYSLNDITKNQSSAGHELALPEACLMLMPPPKK